LPLPEWIVLNHAWRFSDFINLKKDDLPDLNQKPPIPFQRITEKENVVFGVILHLCMVVVRAHRIEQERL
jgi:hypothetical protein